MSSIAARGREPRSAVGFGEFSRMLGKMFFDFQATSSPAGVLSEREQALIALALAAGGSSAEALEAATERCLALGVSEMEMLQARHAARPTTRATVPRRRAG